MGADVLRLPKANSLTLCSPRELDTPCLTFSISKILFSEARQLGSPSCLYRHLTPGSYKSGVSLEVTFDVLTEVQDHRGPDGSRMRETDCWPGV